MSVCVGMAGSVLNKCFCLPALAKYWFKSSGIGISEGNESCFFDQSESIVTLAQQEIIFQNRSECSHEITILKVTI